MNILLCLYEHGLYHLYLKSFPSKLRSHGVTDQLNYGKNGPRMGQNLMLSIIIVYAISGLLLFLKSSQVSFSYTLAPIKKAGMYQCSCLHGPLPIKPPETTLPASAGARLLILHPLIIKHFSSIKHSLSLNVL